MVKNKTFSFINVFGLTIGLTSFLLIALYVFDELTFDRFHKNAPNIYRIIESRTTPEGNATKTAAVAYQVSEKGKSDFPEIKNTARILALGRANISTLENTNVFYEDFLIANAGFLSTFNFKLLQGDRNTALTEPHSVIITEETAKKLFGTADVIGKSIKADRDSVPFKVTGILKNFPVNSHLAFNLCFSESSLTNPGFQQFVSTDWNSNAFTTYLTLDEKANRISVESKINRIVAANQKKDILDKRHFILQPLTDIHFYSAGIDENTGKKGNITYIYVFTIVAFFVLLIACINYMNLTTARFANRAKEIAVRKVAGASRKSLTTQFLAEAFLMTFIAFILGVILVRLLLPSFNSFTEKQLTIGLNTDYRIWVGTIVIILFVGLLSGIYPALFQSNLKPLSLLKSRIQGKGNLSLRRSLVVFQFSLSIIMIVATIVVYLQMQYVNKKDMGFNKDQLVIIDINSGIVRRSAETIKTEFGKISQVKKVAVSSRVPGEWKDIPKIKVRHEKTIGNEGHEMYFIAADDQFLETYQITLVKGRNFLTGSLADSSSVIINEMAAKELGILEPSEQMIEIPGEEPFDARIIGIVRDFNFQSLREPVAPMVVGFKKNPVQSIDYFTVRLATDNASATLSQMETIIQGIDQNHLFEYHFLDKQWNLFYREDKIRQTIFLIVSMLTIFIACLGLFGLATYAAEQRIKEIGIRKVLGASVAGIVTLLSKDFLRLVLIAALVAFPVAWWVMNNWLQDFAYHINISWWIFVIAGSLAVLIALITISFQAIKAAIRNPVKSLRTE